MNDFLSPTVSDSAGLGNKCLSLFVDVLVQPFYGQLNLWLSATGLIFVVSRYGWALKICVSSAKSLTNVNRCWFSKCHRGLCYLWAFYQASSDMQLSTTFLSEEHAIFSIHRERKRGYRGKQMAIDRQCWFRGTFGEESLTLHGHLSCIYQHV